MNEVKVYLENKIQEYQSKVTCSCGAIVEDRYGDISCPAFIEKVYGNPEMIWDGSRTPEVWRKEVENHKCLGSINDLIIYHFLVDELKTLTAT